MAKPTNTEADALRWQRDREVVVATLVLKRIAKPDGFVRIKAHQVSRTGFRVSVLVRQQLPDRIIQTLEVAQSYFVRSDGEVIRESTPALKGNV